MSTPAQEAAARQAYRLLSEHFPAFVMILREDDEIADRYSQIEVSFAGGFYNALGLIEYTKQNFAKIIREQNSDDEEDEKQFPGA